MANSKGRNFSGNEGSGEAQVFGTSIAGEQLRDGLATDNLRIQTEISEKKVQKAKAEKVDVNLTKGFNKDVNGELTEKKETVRAQAREIFRAKGVNKETLAEVDELTESLSNDVDLSAQQKVLFNKANSKLQTQKAGDYFDIEQSLANQEEYMSLSVQEREEFNKPLLVRKEDEWIPHDLPDVLKSSDFDKPYFEEQALEWVATTEEGRQYYQKGIDKNFWSNESQMMNFVKRRNNTKYGDATASTYIRTNVYGDVDNQDVAAGRVRRSNSGPTVNSLTMGDNTITVGAVTEFFPRQSEAYGNTTFYDNDGVETTTNLSEFWPQQLMINTSDRQHIMMGQRKYKSKKEPEDFTDQEVTAALENGKYFDEGTVTDEMTVEQQSEIIRKDLSKKSIKTETETIYIPLTQEMLEEQRIIRPNITRAYENAVGELRFNQAPASVDEFLQGASDAYDAQSAPQVTIDGEKLDAIISNILNGTASDTLTTN